MIYKHESSGHTLGMPAGLGILRASSLSSGRPLLLNWLILEAFPTVSA